MSYKRKRDIWLFGIAGAVILLAISVIPVILLWDGSEESGHVQEGAKGMVTVNNNPIYQDEYELLLKDHRLQYEQVLRQRLNVPDDLSLLEYLKGDQEEYDRLIAELHREELIRVRVQQELAFEYGVIDQPFSYERFLQELENENSARAQKLAAGEPIYGIKKFDANTYYSYYMSNLRLKTIQAMSADELGITDEAVEAYYREYESPIFAEGETLDYTVYDVSELQELSSEARSELERQIKDELATGTDREVNSTFRAEQKHWSGEEIRDMISASEEAERVLLGNEVGTVGGPFYNGKAWLILRYDGFTKTESLGAADRGVLINEMKETAYENAIAQRVQDAAVNYYGENVE